MFSFFIKEPPQFDASQVIDDLLRIVRDVLALANDFLQLQVISDFIDAINERLGDTQGHEHTFR